MLFNYGGKKGRSGNAVTGSAHLHVKRCDCMHSYQFLTIRGKNIDIVAGDDPKFGKSMHL